jgi:hypothetical protein
MFEVVLYKGYVLCRRIVNVNVRLIYSLFRYQLFLRWFYKYKTMSCIYEIGAFERGFGIIWRDHYLTRL